MIDSISTVELAELALDFQQLKAKVAAENIARANTDGVVQRVKFDDLLASVSGLNKEDQPESMLRLQRSLEGSVAVVDEQTTLDQEILELTSARGRYRVIAEALTRKFGMMQILVKGN